MFKASINTVFHSQRYQTFHLMRTVLLLLLVIISSSGYAITISIVTPTTGGYSGDIIDIRAFASGPYSIDTVWAEVQDKKVGLRRKSGGYSNTLSIAGLPQGAHKITVYARDVLGNSTSLSKNFRYDTPPTLTIEYPLANSAHLNKVRIKAQAFDTGGGDCKIQISGLAFDPITVTNSIDYVANARSYSAYESAYEYVITFKVTDPVGQTITKTVPVYFDNSTLLSHVVDAEGMILDVRDERLLVVTYDANNIPGYRIQNMTDGSHVIIPMPANPNLASRGELTPTGAILNVGTESFLWDGNNVINLTATIGMGGNMGYDKERYVLWARTAQSLGYQLGITDLTTMDTTIISPFGIVDQVLTKNRTVYYTHRRESLYRYDIDTKITTKIFGTGARDVAEPVGDGNLIAYMTYTLSYDEPTLHLFDGQTHQTLSLADNNYPEDYAVTGKYVLFTRKDKTKKRQVWLRNPDNTQQQLSFFSNSSVPVLLGKNGQSFFRSAGKMYYADPNTPFMQVSGISGRIYAAANQYYLVWGRTVFRYNLDDVLPVTWEYFRAQKVAEGTRLNWATATEKRAESFTVQRSTNARIFTDIATLSAVGNSDVSQQYQFIDYTANSLNAATIYYRLKQSDLDQKSSYSSLVSIKNEAFSKEIEVRAYPNPFTKGLSVSIRGDFGVSEDDYIEVYSIDGKKKYRQPIENKLNEGVIELNDIPGLQNGLYILKTSINGKLSVVEVVKQ
jgi:hypothetical protein